MPGGSIRWGGRNLPGAMVPRGVRGNPAATEGAEVRHCPQPLSPDARSPHVETVGPSVRVDAFRAVRFDVFFQIYREAWAWEAEDGPNAAYRSADTSPGLPPLHEVYPNEDAFMHDLPRLILEHNIFGVEIDPRAAQIASLALWLRAQRAWHAAGVRREDRPAVGRGHVIAAVAPPAEAELRRELMAGMDE